MSTQTAPDMQLAEAVERAKDGADYMIRCAGHEDGTASLHVSPSPTGVLLKCHAGCDTGRILDAVNLTFADLFTDEDTATTEDTWTPAGPASHAYRYHNAVGNVLFEVLRVPQGASKTFRQRRPSGDPVRPWVWSLEGVERVLYRLPQITAAVRNGERIWCVEGERDVSTLIGLGLNATCNSGGAGKWLPQYTETLAGAEVVVIADADNVGRAHARMVRDQLTEAGCKVAITEAPSPYKDVTELLSRGGKLEDLLWVVPFEETERVKFGVDVLDIITRSVTATEFVVPHTLARKERLLVTGIEGHGKLLSSSTVIPTVHGWTTMGEIRVGDAVFDRDGRTCNVVAKSPEEHPETGSWRLHFNDGSSIDAGGEHQWLTHTLRAREVEAVQAKRQQTAARGTDQRHKIKHHPTVVTTDDIRRTLKIKRSGGGEVTNHSIKLAGALELPGVELPVPAYTLGAWLGDGTTASGTVTVATRDWPITEGMAQDGFEFSVYSGKDSCSTVRPYGLQTMLRGMGLLGYKHIPAIYLRASLEQRLSLLAGICDTDGYCDPRNKHGGRGGGQSVVEVTFTSERLAGDLIALLYTLGVNPHLYEGEATIGDKSYGAKYRVCFTSTFNPFRYAAFKRDRWQPIRTMRSQYRYITSVERLPDQPMQCIQVDSADGTYLVGEGMIPTHNSTLLRQMAVMSASGLHWWSLAECEPQKVLYIDGENEPNQTLEDWQNLIGLAAYHTTNGVERGMLTVLEEWDSEIDLSGPSGTAWLHERVYGYQPDLVLLGPLTNLVGRDLKDDEPVRRLKSAINTARSICGSAFVMEHHAPHKNPTEKRRSIRPYGSSMFLKWPDYGFGMAPTDTEGVYEWQRTRWPRVRKRAWPEALRWGTGSDFPWVECVVPS